MCDGSLSDAAGMAVMHTAVAVQVRPSQQTTNAPLAQLNRAGLF